MKLLNKLFGLFSRQTPSATPPQVEPRKNLADVAYEAFVQQKPVPPECTEALSEHFSSVQNPATSFADERKREMEGRPPTEEQSGEVSVKFAPDNDVTNEVPWDERWKLNLHGAQRDAADKIHATSQFDFLVKGLGEIMTSVPVPDYDLLSRRHESPEQRRERDEASRAYEQALIDYEKKITEALEDKENTVACEVCEITTPTPILIAGELLILRRITNRIQEYCKKSKMPNKAEEFDPLLEQIEKWRQEVKELRWNEIDPVTARSNRILIAGGPAPEVEYIVKDNTARERRRKNSDRLRKVSGQDEE